jgi:hypothetical protein
MRFLILLLISVSAHAGPTLSDQVDVSVLPDKPIVITGDTTDGKGQTIRGPWFQTRFRLTNNSSQPVTVVAISYTIESARDTVVGSFAANDFNFSTECNGKSVMTNYTDFGVFLPGDSGSFRLISRGDCDATTMPVFFFGSLSSQDRYVYTVHIHLQGWFGTYDNPTDSLKKDLTFQTQ